MLSNKSYVSGYTNYVVCMRDVPLRMCMDCLSELIIWNVVKLSKPVDISSMKSALAGPTSLSPVVHSHIVFHKIQMKI
jgi:hypothetical protein